MFEWLFRRKEALMIRVVEGASGKYRLAIYDEEGSAVLRSGVSGFGTDEDARKAAHRIVKVKFLVSPRKWISDGKVEQESKVK